MAKGYRGRTNSYTIAVEKVTKGLQYAYRDRKVKKRVARQDAISDLNAASRHHGLTYSQTITAAADSSIALDRMALSTVARSEPLVFRCLMGLTKALIRQPGSLASKATAIPK